MNTEIVKNEKYGIYYTVIRKDVKNINMRIQDGGKIVISANPYVPFHVIEKFVEDKIDWVLQKQKDQGDRVKTRSLREDEVFCFGKKLKVITHILPYERVKRTEDQIEVTAKSLQRIQRLVDKEMDKLLQSFIEDRVMYYMGKLEGYRLAYPEIRYRKMTSRWGSCEPRRNRITMNRNLMICPKEFIEYVVLHELVHLIQPNHSKAFYATIAYYMPDYKERIKLVQTL